MIGDIIMKKTLALLFFSLFFVFAVNIDNTKAAEATTDAEKEFDLTIQEKQEQEVILPNGEKAVIGIEPVPQIESRVSNDYTASKGTSTWRVYFDAATLASEFYATVYVPSSGYSEIKEIYGERPIRILLGTVKSEDFKLVRQKETSSLPAHAYYRITTEWLTGGGIGNTGSSSPTLKISVKGSKVTTEAVGFWL